MCQKHLTVFKMKLRFKAKWKHLLTQNAGVFGAWGETKDAYRTLDETISR